MKTLGEDLRTRVQAILHQIDAAAESAELARQPNDDVIRALAEVGVFRAFVPKTYGGYEIDFESFMHIGMDVAEACTSTGWITTFYMEHNWLLAHFDPEVQAAVWGDKGYFLAPATISPNGVATPVDGGYRVSGQWQWGTGVMHADWIMVAARVDIADQRPQLRMFMMPRSNIEVIDTWHVDGMSATGSNDMRVDDVFVPAPWSQDVGQMMLGHTTGSMHLDSPTFKVPMVPFKCITAACPSVGAARRAVKLFAQRIQERTIFGSAQKQHQSSAAQMRLGHLMVRVQQCETLMLQLARDLETLGHEAQPSSVEVRSRFRLSAAHIVHAARDIVRDVMEASGASAHFNHHPLQRIHRDVHTLACHTVFDMDLGGGTIWASVAESAVKQTGLVALRLGEIFSAYICNHQATLHHPLYVVYQMFNVFEGITLNRHQVCSVTNL